MMTSHESTRFDCAVDATMSVIEGRWKVTILCKLMMKGDLRFNHLMKEMEGVSARILSKQLKEMESDGLIAREECRESIPKVEYSITPKGKSLAPLLQMMADWGLRNMFSRMVMFDEDMINNHIDAVGSAEH